MAINLKFDLIGNPEPPSIVLANRNGNKLGQLNVNVNSIDVSDKFNDASEFSFTLNKYIDGEPTPLWNKVVDFKLVYCPEWDLWFEIKVELDEKTETVKTVFCTQLGQAELSQIKIYNIHINEEGDPNWDTDNETYKSTILYDPQNTDISLLHRLLKDKAPHYSIAYVDESIQRIQKTFSFDDTSICDAFDEIAEEIGCLFVYNSNSTKGGKPSRTISVYDLQQNCKDCGHRGEFTDKCPKCGSTNIKYGYGEDTTIFVTADELATEGIQLATDVDSVKNCFKLEGGDDLMTATIRNCNPNGSDYIWYFSDALKEDMSDELVEKLENYDEKYKEYYNERISELSVDVINQYNELVEKYNDYYDTKSACLNCGHEDYFENKCPNCDSENILNGQKLQTIPTVITGYPDLMTAYYNTIDLLLYLESGLMPNVEMSDTSAEEQLNLLTTSALSPVAVNVKDVNNASLATADSAVLSMAKVLIRPTYKVVIKEGSSSLSELLSDKDGEYKTWTGKFVVTNYSDETDIASHDDDEEVISVRINNATETFIEQKIEKTLNKENTDDYSITGLFAKDYDAFCVELQKYALNPLKSFGEACDTCLSILTEQGAGNEVENKDLYDALYKPYFEKQQAVNEEIKVRENEIAIIEGVWDKYDENNPQCTTWGLQQYIEKCQQDIQEALDFEKHLGKDLWLEFCAYRREDKYSNDNYVSDGLNNAELFKKANEFIEVAQEEIFKSAELQHSISSTLNNLLSFEKFKPFLKSFKTGNWIRVQADDEVYKLRLLEYGFGYGDFGNISVEFSDVTKIKNGVTDVKEVLKQASSMASSYDSVQRQAKKGNVARSTIDQWLVDGLDSADVQIKNNDSEEILITKNGLLARSYDDITGTYSPEQFKLTHNIIAYTDDNWETVSSALGKHNYKKWDGSNFVDDEGYGLTSKFVTAGYITGSQVIGGEIVSSNYNPKTKGTYINLLNGDFDFAGGKIVYDSSDNEVKLKGVTIQWTGDDGVNAPEVKVENITGLDKYLDQLEELEDQLDGRVQTYSQSKDPSESWTDEEKANHIGDLWLNPDNGITKRWTGTEWVEVTDGDLKELAQSKAQIFTTQPTPPYYKGDLWVQGSTGDIKHCINSKETGSYVASDWAVSSKYTDDAALAAFINGDYADNLDSINNQIDKKAETWYQSERPDVTEKWNTDELKSLHVGDLWYDIDNNSKTYVYNSSYEWEEMNAVPKDVFDMADGSCSLYISKPSNYRKNDIWILDIDNVNGANTTYPRYEKGTFLVSSNDNIGYAVSDWSEQVRYTDDTAFETWLNGDFQGVIDELKKQIDGKADTYYQETMPTWDDEDSAHAGDMWYCTADYNVDGTTYLAGKTYMFNGTTWTEVENEIPEEVFDLIDSKRQIFVSKPNSTYKTGDLWIVSDADCYSKYNIINGVTYAENTTLVAKLPSGVNERTEYVASDWVDISTHEGKLALDSAQQAINALNDISDDNKITPTEKQQIKFMMQNITSEYNGIIKQCNKYSLTTTDFISAYNKLKNLTDEIIEDLTTTMSSLPSGYPDLFTEYYSKKETIISEIEDATKKYSDDSLNSFISGDYKDTLNELNNQINVKAETWYQSEDPSDSWSEDEYSKHVGDLWHYTGNTTDAKGRNSEWIWQSVGDDYQWVAMDVPDEVFDKIDGKSTIYVMAPENPNIGDLLIPTTTNGDYVEGKVYKWTGTKWMEIAYSDDTVFETWLNNDFQDAIQELQKQIDGKANTYYQAEMPTWENDNSEHAGDMWYCTSDYTASDGTEYFVGKTYMFDGDKWVEVENEIPEEVFDLIDGKASIYITMPTDTSELNSGDLMILLADNDDYKANKVYRWTGTKWAEIKYTDDSSLETFINGDYKDALDEISNEINAKSRSWYQEEDPSKSWDKDENHEGDLWYNSSSSSQITYIYKNNKWEQMSVPKELFDTIDGKATIYITNPTNQNVLHIGDLLIPTTTNGDYVEGKVYKWTGTKWMEIAYSDDTSLNGFISGDYKDTLDELNNQINAKARSWYQSIDPSMLWDKTEDHEGDLWYNSSADSQVTYIYSNGAWKQMSVPKELFDTIDGKATIYITTPNDPNKGDLLIPATDIKVDDVVKYKANKVYRYSGSDWIEISYSDDTSLNEFIDNEYATTIQGINNQIDKKSETWYQSGDPSVSWTTNELKLSHVGDLWCDTDNNGKTYIYNSSYKWEEMNGVPKDVFDTIDSIASIYVYMPGNPVIGDLFIPPTDIEEYKSGKVYKYNGSTWVEINYTDDTRADEAYTRADSAYDLADNAYGFSVNAKTIGDKLVSGLGFQETEIAGEYIISPVIAGGHLLIGDMKGTYAQITTDGLLQCANAQINGDIVANSLILGDSASISSSKVTGLSAVATSGSYDDLQDKPDISQLVSDAIKDGDIVIETSDVEITEESLGNGITKVTTTVGDNIYTTYSSDSANYILTNIGFGTEPDDYSSNYTSGYFKVSEDGLLVADNAIIWGTIYATDGKFTGDIVADSLTLRQKIQLGNENDGYHTWINPDGTLSTQNANINGEINAVSGSIGGFNIKPNDTENNIAYGWLYSGNSIGDDKSIFLSAADMSGTVSKTILDDWRLTVGKHFGVSSDGTTYMSNCEITGGSLRMGTEDDGYHTWISSDGVLNASGANIDGTITAVDGVIGGWEIAENSLFSNNFKITTSNSRLYASLVDDNKTSPVRIVSDGIKLQASYTGGTWTPGVAGKENWSIQIDVGHSSVYDVEFQIDIQEEDSRGAIEVDDYEVSSDGIMTVYLCVPYYQNREYDDGINYSITVTYYSPTFMLLEDGSLYASAANMTGNVKATSGEIGGLIIDKVEREVPVYEEHSYRRNVTTGYVPYDDGMGNIYYIGNTVETMPGEIIDAYCTNVNMYASFSGDMLTLSAQSTKPNTSIGGYVYVTCVSGTGVSSAYTLSCDDNTFELQIKDGTSTFICENVQMGDIDANNLTAEKVVASSGGFGDIWLSSTALQCGNNKLDLSYIAGNVQTYNATISYSKSHNTITVHLDNALKESKTFSIRYSAVWSSSYKTCSVTIPSNGTSGYTTVAAFWGVDYAQFISDNGDCLDTLTFNQGSSGAYMSVNANLLPETTNNVTLGIDNKRWKEIWCNQSSINSTSDKNEKNSIECLPDKYDVFFDNLQPVRYKFNQNESNRYHVGFIAQDVADALNVAEISTTDFAGYLAYTKEDGTMGYGLRYSEFIALNTCEIQKLKKRVEELEIKLKALNK